MKVIGNKVAMEKLGVSILMLLVAFVTFGASVEGRPCPVIKVYQDGKPLRYICTSLIPNLTSCLFSDLRCVSQLG